MGRPSNAAKQSGTIVEVGKEVKYVDPEQEGEAEKRKVDERHACSEIRAKSP